MSDNIKMQDTEYTNEWVSWIEEAVDKEYFKYYEYNQFNNIQHIGTGGFGKVYRANWKRSEKQFALKSFFSLDNVTVKEIVRELKIQREVDFHDNIIRCYGITKLETDNHNNYWLVMEYADGGNLRCYLKENFTKLSWDDKYKMAHQLSCAVSCLHNEGIVHRDLHSCNILVRNNTIKLADFGLSKRIGASSNFQSKLFGIVPYVDPKSFSRRRNNNQSTQMYSLNEKSDIYSEQYDIGLALDISQGHRETVVPDTPDEYVKIYTKCWYGEPDNRPTIYQVVDWLNSIITKKDVILEYHQISNELELNENSSSSNNSELQGDLSQLIQNFNKMNTKEIDSMAISSKQENHSTEKDFNMIANEINDFITELNIKGIEKESRKRVIEYFYNHNINSQEFYNWLLNNQNSSNSIFILGYFNHYGIVTNRNDEKAFNLYINTSEKNHILTQQYIGHCYRLGHGTMKNDKLAFEYHEKVANENLSYGQLSLGYCYENGIGVEKDFKKAFYLYGKAANDGNVIAIFNLGYFYKNGIGIEKDYNKTFELYQNAANLGYNDAQYNLALMYEKGNGITKDIGKAIYWYEKSAKQGDQDAQNKLKELQKNQ
ncbi:kinase-like domain-containing protein [Rhizophagus irregularis DAOM 181602=DAOM 197198]|uniref:Kinase-like domain-containing protein n=1 Tax=Rhizophagus irregularis (strain DAOM 181602 / DAOM 197198 / MUCL 43194) TaxID=747089 RepID=A0A2P4QBC4_RHIID|nr:kinase-like domain-containing protein [Rhizophagus irregularis DAOM 181602=DAOM 197198]POG74939.1 kinase-like domain-containing protein [Rhizophagus irregularis DAOM 181602=DAOM 197198]|eukprot:XP_025181805.1 kinase-like domain-containing protein [Rhizophagus irregularis DAOM 181602=DAOM 197198]